MRVIDSHTGGEPTRLILSGGPDLGDGSLAERTHRLFRDHRAFCSAVLSEPRGHDAMVGALLVPPSDPTAAAAVIYFNPIGPLGMCGHATIGTAVSLHHLGRLDLGRHHIETPVGTVGVHLQTANRAAVENVESDRYRADVVVEVPGQGRMSGDIAWGGNWFFLTSDVPAPLTLAHVDQLTTSAVALRQALAEQGITGRNGAVIDHIEFVGPPLTRVGHARNFVLCPGTAYDRSPCGTGSAAKLACLAADGDLAPGVTWIQESVISSTYALHYRPGPTGGVIATITGTAFVTGDTVLNFDPADPYRAGITSQEVY
ncbi:proline racemase family protein [Phaeobacter gallaeciensis]|uniref:4-hydroxyproline epimerase n=1 Tax=Phaeobacter gallaeciensis TaxID=60890 RepID=A0AAC9ZBB6_9RHOB|nr:proline racemase family protein [Phaeobacter gallaeciensis]AHD10725.1 Proline racemase [Phaeobacter gallaeciensis DSM 26640]ATE93988.1 4-hydroxyproline epimerase [Phaeobacter gallaeciensis]ATE96191.1 4-hydroxyproline epimerase [Phaeobacter gallaeciensis]ATF02652.1 4-hydroxyproline epimerase [Phaeobacter gallaeciensis]ATF07032.1 4-hydroxyproline epimerase [Phaeobacter gallaeciensis]